MNIFLSSLKWLKSAKSDNEWLFLHVWWHIRKERISKRKWGMRKEEFSFRHETLSTRAFPHSNLHLWMGKNILYPFPEDRTDCRNEDVMKRSSPRSYQPATGKWTGRMNVDCCVLSLLRSSLLSSGLLGGLLDRYAVGITRAHNCFNAVYCGGALLCLAELDVMDKHLL